MIIVGVYNEVNKSNYHIVVNVVSEGVPKECSNTEKTRRCMVIKKTGKTSKEEGYLQNVPL